MCAWYDVTNSKTETQEIKRKTKHFTFAYKTPENTNINLSFNLILVILETTMSINSTNRFVNVGWKKKCIQANGMNFMENMCVLHQANWYGTSEWILTNKKWGTFIRENVLGEVSYFVEAFYSVFVSYPYINMQLWMQLLRLK